MAIFTTDTPSNASYDLVSLDLGGLGAVDLSVERALKIIPASSRENYAIMYDWFMSGGDEIGSRLFGKRIPGVSEDFKHCAERGIHVPSKQIYAASVTVKHKSKYGADAEPVQMGDGTWLLTYSAHENMSGGETDPRWNRGLIRCWEDGVPVGVFYQTRSDSHSYMRALAFVENYDPTSKVFILHGPVTHENMALYQSPLHTICEEAHVPVPSLEELQNDTRKYKEVRQAVRVGQEAFRRKLIAAYNGECAISACGVLGALQAAHIVDYHGAHTNHVQNGILMRADLHALFDNALIAIKPDTFEIELAKRIENSEYADIVGSQKKLRLPANSSLWPDESCLQVKYNKYIQKQRAS